jgi:hypothetical protein
MKKSVLLFFLAATMVGSWGCGKQKMYDARNFWVTVQERGTGRAIPNAEITAIERVSNGIFAGAEYYTIGIFTTDQNGRAYIQGGDRDVSELKTNTGGLKYFDSRHHTEGTGITQPFLESDPKIIEMIPFAWLKVKIDFSIYQGEFDYISYSYGSLHNGNVGMGTQVTEAGIVFGNTPSKVYFYGYKDGRQVKTWQNDYYAPGHDTLLHVATYTP